MASGFDVQLAAIKSVVDAIKAKTDLIGVASVTWASPWVEDEDGDVSLTIHAGADYSGVNALPAGTVSGWTGRNLDAVAAKFRMIRDSKWKSNDLAAELEVAATLSQSGTTVTYSFSLTAAQTASLSYGPPAGNYRWQIVVVDDHPFVLAGAGASKQSGVATVLKMIGAA